MPSNGMVLLLYPLMGIGRSGVILILAVPAEISPVAEGWIVKPDINKARKQQTGVIVDLMKGFISIVYSLHAFRKASAFCSISSSVEWIFNPHPAPSPPSTTPTLILIERDKISSVTGKLPLLMGLPISLKY
jgi:hypothetical protein